MPFRKKVLYYGLMLFLTLLALEGMARIAYYAAYGHWPSRGGLKGPVNLTPPPPPNLCKIFQTFGRYSIPFTAISGTCLTTT